MKLVSTEIKLILLIILIPWLFYQSQQNPLLHIICKIHDADARQPNLISFSDILLRFFGVRQTVGCDSACQRVHANQNCGDLSMVRKVSWVYRVEHAFEREDKRKSARGYV